MLKNMSPTLKENSGQIKLIWGWVYLCDFHLISYRFMLINLKNTSIEKSKLLDIKLIPKLFGIKLKLNL
jgi:hypothetical protein